MTEFTPMFKTNDEHIDYSNCKLLEMIQKFPPNQEVRNFIKKSREGNGKNKDAVIENIYKETLLSQYYIRERFEALAGYPNNEKLNELKILYEYIQKIKTDYDILNFFTITKSLCDAFSNHNNEVTEYLALKLNILSYKKGDNEKNAIHIYYLLESLKKINHPNHLLRGFCKYVKEEDIKPIQKTLKNLDILVKFCEIYLDEYCHNNKTPITYIKSKTTQYMANIQYVDKILFPKKR